MSRSTFEHNIIPHYLVTSDTIIMSHLTTLRHIISNITQYHVTFQHYDTNIWYVAHYLIQNHVRRGKTLISESIISSQIHAWRRKVEIVHARRRKFTFHHARRRKMFSDHARRRKITILHARRRKTQISSKLHLKITPILGNIWARKVHNIWVKLPHKICAHPFQTSGHLQ